jgi:hypothetical protein
VCLITCHQSPDILLSSYACRQTRLFILLILLRIVQWETSSYWIHHIHSTSWIMCCYATDRLRDYWSHLLLSFGGFHHFWVTSLLKSSLNEGEWCSYSRKYSMNRWYQIVRPSVSEYPRALFASITYVLRCIHYADIHACRHNLRWTHMNESNLEQFEIFSHAFILSFVCTSQSMGVTDCRFLLLANR